MISRANNLIDVMSPDLVQTVAKSFILMITERVKDPNMSLKQAFQYQKELDTIENQTKNLELIQKYCPLIETIYEEVFLEGYDLCGLGDPDSGLSDVEIKMPHVEDFLADVYQQAFEHPDISTSRFVGDCSQNIFDMFRLFCRNVIMDYLTLDMDTQVIT